MKEKQVQELNFLLEKSFTFTKIYVIIFMVEKEKKLIKE